MGRPTDRKPMLMRSEADLLAEAARAATRPVDLRTTVERFAELALEATGAWRASIFLIEDDRLVLWASHSRETDDVTRLRNWQRGLDLEPIDLDEVPARREFFDLGLPIAIGDARESELVPESWVASFGLGALIVAPLVGGGEGLGVIVIDWPEPRDIGDGELELVGAVAGSLALAVHNALLTTREAERSAALQSLLEATTVLRSSEGLEQVADRLTEPLAGALGASGVSICLFERDGDPPPGTRIPSFEYRTIAGWNPTLPRRGSLRELTRGLRRRVADAWQERFDPLLLTSDELDGLTPRVRPGSLLLLPLAGAGDTLLGFVLVNLDDREPPERAVDLARALTSHLAAAVERARLEESLALETERLRGLCTLWGFEDEALEAYSATIEEAVGPALGFSVVRVSVADGELRDLGSFAAPDELDEQIMARWRRASRRPDPIPSCAPGELAAALTVHGEVVGVVRARARHAGLTSREAQFLDTLAVAFGRAIEQEAARRAARQADLDLALAEERERVAARLHDTVGRLLYALNLRAATLKLAAGPGTLGNEARQIEHLARSGLASLRRAVATLASMRLDDDLGLVGALERLAAPDAGDVADLGDDPGGARGPADGPAISLAIDGTTRSLPPKVEEALLQVAREALANVERHARASNVMISLDMSGDDVVLRVRDDGLGLGRSDAPPGTGLGLELARKAIEPLGGYLELIDSAPGVEVVARVPVRPVAVEVS